jgi:hypothetical protein
MMSRGKIDVISNGRQAGEISNLVSGCMLEVFSLRSR